jgi:hypothetical protein
MGTDMYGANMAGGDGADSRVLAAAARYKAGTARNWSVFFTPGVWSRSNWPSQEWG